MRPILSRVLRQASPPEPIAAGTYHYQAPAEAAIPYRLHLRVDEKGDGLLIVNASTILHLNATATAHAYEVVRGASAKEGATAIAQRYRVAKRQARADHEQLRQKLTAIATAPDVDPVLYYGLERAEPYTLPTSAPFRLDLALTYAMDPDGALDPLARRRVDRELTTVEWKQVLDKAWQAGIPHVTFTGGEPTRREDLVKLIAHAESLGQVAGLVTQGRRLSDPSFMARLEQAGLDHLLIVLEPSDASSMSGLRNALASEVYAAAHLTLSHEDWQGKIGLLAQLREQGLGAISISAAAPPGAARLTPWMGMDGSAPTSLARRTSRAGSGDPAGSASESSSATATWLAKARERAAELGLDLIWDLPAPYSRENPMALEVAEEATPGAGRAWLYVEPDGDVLPTQGVETVLGNLQRDAWETIWGRAKDWASERS